jgi:uroporphyrinogen-III decarboxylase
MMNIQPIRPKWKGTMTDRERFNRQMHYLSVDRCFNMEFGYWDDNFSQWPIFYENGICNNEEADIFFNFDQTTTINGNIWISPSFEDIVVEERENTKIIMNADGLLAEIPKDGHSTIPHYIKSTIVTPNDWEKVKSERFRPDDPDRQVDIEALKKVHTKLRDYPLGVWVGSMIGKIRDMLTFEGLAYALYDHPLMVEDMVETACVMVENFLDQVLPHFDFDYAAGWEDICFKSGPIVSPKFYRNVITPRYKRIHDKLSQYGIDIWWIDCDGDVRPILPAMMEGGVNCLFPYEVNSCAHPVELLAEYGKDLRIMGGIDKIELGKGKEAIRAYLDSVVPLVERGGYIPFCDHRCPPNVDQEDYLFYLDLKEQMFGMK